MKFFLLTMMMTCLLLMATLLLMKLIYYNKETSTTFECGFDPYNTPRSPFSMRFFKITILFLIFDIEIVLIIPMIIIYTTNYMYLYSCTFIIILVIMGLIYEWYLGALNWMT